MYKLIYICLKAVSGRKHKKGDLFLILSFKIPYFVCSNPISKFIISSFSSYINKIKKHWEAKACWSFAIKYHLWETSLERPWHFKLRTYLAVLLSSPHCFREVWRLRKRNFYTLLIRLPTDALIFWHSGEIAELFCSEFYF